MIRKRTKETNIHVKKYNRFRIFGGIIYYTCLIIPFAYWICIMLLYLLNVGEDIILFPFTNIWSNIVLSFLLPLISIGEYLYEKLLEHRATNILTKREERAKFYSLHS